MENLNSTIILMVALILTTVTFSCGTEELPEKECNLSNIKGTWEWIETTGGVSGGSLSPSNTGLTMRLEINDSIWNEYMNDSLISSIQYAFIQDTNSTFLEGAVSFANQSWIPIQIHNCSLLIKGIFHDGMSSHYEYVE